jgi:hypothetical protein
MSDNTAGVVTLKDTAFNTPTSLPFTTSDIVGGTSIGGFYEVSAVGTDTVTLGSKVFDVPAVWDTPSADGAFCFGRLRFPDAPGMDFTDERGEVGGRVFITAVTNGSPVTLTTLTTQNYLSITTAENIDILDGNMSALATNVAATRVDANNFTVPTDFATIANAKWIIPSGGKYKFGDARSKGDYVYRTWVLSLADSSVLSSSQTGFCLAFTSCNPNVAMITPNGETTANGNTHAFPSSVNNGEVWLGQIQMWMIDPFWQQPHSPVAPSYLGTDFEVGVDILNWSMDNGSCAENSVVVGGGGENIFHLFYPMYPFVEARCTLPTVDGDVAAAPAGVDITAAATPVAQASIGNSEGLLVDAIVVPVTPWSILAAQQSCVDASGQFSDEYQNNGTPPST